MARLYSPGAGAWKGGIALAALVLAACGGDSDDGQPMGTVGGTVSGLQGSGLVLFNGGSDALPIAADGSFVFAKPVAIGEGYRVTVMTQPTGPVQNCMVMNSGSRGFVSDASVGAVTVVCRNVGSFLYAANRDYDIVSGFRIDPSTGGLVQLPGGATGFYVVDDASTTTDGSFLHVPGPPGAVFAVDGSTGALIATGAAPYIPHALLEAPVFARHSPFGYGIVHDPPSPGGDSPDRVYTVAFESASGAETLVGESVTAGVTDSAIALDPNGRFAYVASPVPCVPSPRLSCQGIGPAGLWVFALHPTSGAPAAVSSTPYATASPPQWVAAEPSGRFVYTAGPDPAGSGRGVVMALAVDAVTGSLTALPHSPYAADDPSPGPLAIDPSGTFMFVTNPGANSVSAFAIDAMGGELAPVAGSPFRTDPRPRSIVFDPSGKFAYITHASADDGGVTDLGSITGWSLDTSGALTPLAGNRVTGVARQDVAIHPSGRFAYVANAPAGLSAYGISTGGMLTASAPVAPSGSAPLSVAVSPSGRFAYVANSGSDDVSVFAIDATTGAATPVTAGGVAAGRTPITVVVEPGEAFAYVANNGSDDISAYRIDSRTGALTPLVGGPFAAGGFPRWVTVDAQGRYVYVANKNPPSISVHAIDRASGTLSQVPGSPFSTSPFGDSPTAIAVDPSGRYAYVATLSGLLGFSIDPSTGALVLLGPPFGAAAYVSAVTIDPTGRFVYAISDSPHGLLAFSIDAATGTLSAVPGSPFPAPIGASRVTVDPQGSRAYVVSPVGVWVHGRDTTTGALGAGNLSAPGLVRPGSLAIAGP